MIQKSTTEDVKIGKIYRIYNFERQSSINSEHSTAIAKHKKLSSNAKTLISETRVLGIAFNSFLIAYAV